MRWFAIGSGQVGRPLTDIGGIPSGFPGRGHTEPQKRTTRMRSRTVVRKTFAITAGLLLAIGSGCGDSTGLDLNPLLVRDTVIVAAPLPGNADLPTALDIMTDGRGGIVGGRFPERVSDALQWDFLVEIDEQTGNLVLLPARAVGIGDSRAAITPPIEGTSFDDLREAPGQSTFIPDSAVTMEVGNVHVARSRVSPASLCMYFAKLQPLRVDVAEGILELQIVANQRCSDPRLVAAD